MDRGDIRRIMVALFLQETQMLFGFFEIHLDCPAHGIEFKDLCPRQGGIGGQEYGPIMLTHRLLAVAGITAHKQQPYFNLLFRVFSLRQVKLEIDGFGLVVLTVNGLPGLTHTAFVKRLSIPFPRHHLAANNLAHPIFHFVFLHSEHRNLSCFLA